MARTAAKKPAYLLMNVGDLKVKDFSQFTVSDLAELAKDIKVLGNKLNEAVDSFREIMGVQASILGTPQSSQLSLPYRQQPQPVDYSDYFGGHNLDTVTARPPLGRPNGDEILVDDPIIGEDFDPLQGSPEIFKDNFIPPQTIEDIGINVDEDELRNEVQRALQNLPEDFDFA